jgi:hypothetical protein
MFSFRLLLDDSQLSVPTYVRWESVASAGDGLQRLRENDAPSPEGTAEQRGPIFAVPSGLLDDAFLTQDYVLGYFQTSLRD